MLTRVVVRWAFAVLASLAACGGSDSKPPPNNAVSADALAPRQIDDRREIAAYVEAFPVADYRVVPVGGQGRFYIDDTHDTIKDFLRRGKSWEIVIDNVTKKYARTGTTALDIGAHIGTHSLQMSRSVGADGRVYSFEPQRKLYRELVHNMRLNAANNVVPLRFAAGATPGVIEMSPAAAGNEGGTGIGGGGDRAELRTIDSFGFQNVSFVKIDVEGFEDSVIDGARETITRWKPVLIVEIMGGSEYKTASPEIRAKIDATKQKVTGLGYEVTLVTAHDYLFLPAK